MWKMWQRHCLYERWHPPHIVHSLHTILPQTPEHLYLLPLAGLHLHLQLHLHFGRAIPNLHRCRLSLPRGWSVR